MQSLKKNFVTKYFSYAELRISWLSVTSTVLVRQSKLSQALRRILG